MTQTAQILADYFGQPLANLAAMINHVSEDHLLHRLTGLRRDESEYANKNPHYFTDPPIELISEALDFLVVKKPWGYRMDCLQISKFQPSVESWFHSKYPNSKFRACQQLDFCTSGLLIVARSKQAAGNIGKQFQNRHVTKKYTAVLCGYYSQPDELITLQIGDGETNLGAENQFRQEVVQTNGKTCITRISVSQRGRITAPSGSILPVTKVVLEALTGRTHQLRVTAEWLGHPILGDHIYGNRQSEYKEVNLDFYRLCLHARSLKFKDPSSEETLTFETSDPFVGSLFGFSDSDILLTT